MKQYKLTAWPELPPRFQSTSMRRVVSELSQRFVTSRELARSSGASTRAIEDLIAGLEKDGMLVSRPAPHGAGRPESWLRWLPLAAVRGLVRARR